jgi:hypothetical protein
MACTSRKLVHSFAASQTRSNCSTLLMIVCDRGQRDLAGHGTRRGIALVAYSRGTSGCARSLYLRCFLLPALNHDRSEECTDAGETDDEEEDGNGDGVGTRQEVRLEGRRGGEEWLMDEESNIDEQREHQIDEHHTRAIPSQVLSTR